MDVTCTSCDVNKFSSTGGTNACFGCPQGRTAPHGSVACSTCPAGTFRVDTPGNKEIYECQPCDVGTFSLAGEVACKFCSSGQYNVEQGQSSCQSCAAGKWNNNKGSKVVLDCNNCMAGKYSTAEGASSSITCIECAPGKTGTVVGATSVDQTCETCVAGRFRPSANDDGSPVDLTSCTLCPRGYHTATTASTLCISCVPGLYQDQTSQELCKNCNVDSFTNSTAAKFCFLCNVGTSTENKKGQSSCLTCNVGSYGKTCSPCLSGEYRGQNDNPSRCLKCAVGQTSTVGSATCQTCDLGKYGDKDGCIECSLGKYQDGRGQTGGCKNCPPDTFNPNPSSTSLSECQPCPSEKTTGTVDGSTKDTACLCRRGDYYQNDQRECIACPNGADCSQRDGILIHQLVPLPGNWRPDALNPTFSACDRCCPHGQCLANVTARNNNATTTFDPDHQCLEGYSGVLCLSCADEYIFRGDTCVACPGGPQFSNALFGLLGFAALIFVVVFVIFARYTKKKKKKKMEKIDVEDTGNRCSGQLKISLTYLQILAAIPGVFPSVPWPQTFIEFTLPLSFVNLDFLTVFAESQCSLAVSFFDAFTLHMMLPAFLVLAVISAYLAAAMCAKTTLNRRKELLSQILILLVLILYPGLATRIFSVFRCQEIPGVEGQLLQADMTIQCYREQHNLFTKISFAFLVLYIFGVPLAIFIVLWRSRKYLHNVDSPHHEIVKSRLGALYLQYEPQYWWFELVIILEKMVMTGAMCVVAQGSALQLVVANIVMLLYMLLVLKTAPFEEDSEDWSSFVGCFALCITTLGGLCLIMDDPLDPTFDSNVMMILLVALNILSMSVQLGIMVLLDCGVWDRLCMRRGKKLDRTSRGRRKSTQILPEETRNIVKSWDVSGANVIAPQPQPPPPIKRSSAVVGTSGKNDEI